MMAGYVAPHRKLLWHTASLEHLKSGLPPEPINAEIDLSNRCSLGCEFCHFAYTHTKGPAVGKQDKPHNAVVGGDLMDVDLAVSIVKQLSWGPQRPFKSVIWTGGGEPTLHPHFDRIIKHTAKYLEQGIYTHGGHINKNRAAMMRDYMTWVTISLDAVNAKDYVNMKGVDRFNDVLAGVERLMAAKGAATVGLSYMITAYNGFRIPDMVKMGHALGVDYVRFRPTIRFDSDNPGAPNENAGWVDHAIKYLEVYEGDPFVSVETDRFRQYRDWTGHGYDSCYWAALQICITPNGKVWICVNKREHPAAEIGDLSVEKWNDIRRRMTVPGVDKDCRVMCRGHVANQMLDQVMNKPVHADFI